MFVVGFLSRGNSRSVHSIDEPMQELCGCVPLPDAALPRPRVQPQSRSLVVDEAGDDLDPVLDRIERSARVDHSSHFALRFHEAHGFPPFWLEPCTGPQALAPRPWAVRNWAGNRGCFAASCGDWVAGKAACRGSGKIGVVSWVDRPLCGGVLEARPSELPACTRCGTDRVLPGVERAAQEVHTHVGAHLADRRGTGYSGGDAPRARSAASQDEGDHRRGRSTARWLE